MIRGQPALEHLAGLIIQATPDHRSCVHIQPNTDPKIMVSWPRCAPRGLGGGIEDDRVSEGFELSDVTALLGRWIDVSVVVIGAQILVSDVWIMQQVPDDDEDGATNGDHCSGLAAVSGDTAVPGREESVCLAGADRGLAQDARQVRVAISRGSAAFGLAGRRVDAGGGLRPGAQVSGGREPRHIDPDLADDGGCGDRTDAGRSLRLPANESNANELVILMSFASLMNGTSRSGRDRSATW